MLQRVVISAITAAAALVGAAAAALPVTPPTEFCRGFFLLPITLEGRAATEALPSESARTLWFIFDTGASNTHIDPDSLQRVSGRRLPPGARVSLLNASAGPLDIRRLAGRVTELDHLSISFGRELDGILGFRTFRDYLLTLDYPAREMRLEAGGLPAPDDRSVFSSRGPDARPWLDVDLAGERQLLLLDSGASAGIVVNNLSGYSLTAPPRQTGATTKIDQWMPRWSARLAGDATFGSHRIEHPVLQGTTDTQLIGYQVLRNFVLTFDQRNRRVRIVRHAQTGAITSDPVRSHGLIMAPRPEGLRVELVLPGTAAARADIRQGDLITQMNGAGLLERGCPEHDPESVVVTRRRGADSLDIELTMTTLVE